MRLATLDDGTRDGALLVVDRSGTRGAAAPAIARNLQAALDDWPRVEPLLRRLQAALAAGAVDSVDLNGARLLAPLPRAYEWIDGSAFINHVLLARRARGAQPPPGLLQDPLVYQGGSGVLLPGRAPVMLPSTDWGLDFEAEICVVLGDTLMGTRSTQALESIRLLMLANDWTYRNLVPDELAKGFGFFVSKPATAFAPFAVTPDEFGASFEAGRLNVTVHCAINGKKVGQVDAGQGMHFSFADLIEHVTTSRALTAGTILGSGTVSNEQSERGVCCIAEARAREVIRDGVPSSRYLHAKDIVRIEARDASGWLPFGVIEQQVTRADAPIETLRGQEKNE